MINKKKKKKTDPKQDFLFTDDDSFLDEVMKMCSGDIGDDEYTNLMNGIIDLQKFAIDTYTSHMALVTLLVEKGVITQKEFLSQKDTMTMVDEIKSLYTECEKLRKSINRKEK